MSNYTLVIEFPRYYLYSNYTNKLILSGPLNDLIFGLKEYCSFNKYNFKHFIKDISLKDIYK